jgi:hypothetical protein
MRYSVKLWTSGNIIIILYCWGVKITWRLLLRVVSKGVSMLPKKSVLRRTVFRQLVLHTRETGRADRAIQENNRPVALAEEASPPGGCAKLRQPKRRHQLTVRTAKKGALARTGIFQRARSSTGASEAFATSFEFYLQHRRISTCRTVLLRNRAEETITDAEISAIGQIGPIGLSAPAKKQPFQLAAITRTRSEMSAG